MTNVRTKIENGDYDTALTYVSMSLAKNALTRFSKNVVTSATKTTYDAKVARLEKAYEDAKNATDAYSADIMRLKAQFQIDLEAENGMTDHPKAELLFSKAWEAGHSYGLVAVVDQYEDLIDLV